ncbi:hypothetical protein [Tenacibaculum maritimum]
MNIKNKITFYRFKNSPEFYNPNKKSSDIKFNSEIEKLKKIIDEHPIDLFKELNEEDNSFINKFLKLKNDFLSNLSENEQMSLFGIKDLASYIFSGSSNKLEIFKKSLDISSPFNQIAMKSSSVENMSPVLENFKKMINDEIDITVLKKLLLQINYNSIFIKYEESKALFKGIHERIDINDISDINNIINEMNNEGWNIKQIESIQSGKHNSSYGAYSNGGYGYGYGYSFTEGIIIIWEK